MLELPNTTNIFDLDVDCVVIPTNCKRVLGAGLAKQFADRYPTVAREYRKCKVPIAPGSVECWSYSGAPELFVTLATKDDWRFPARLPWIEMGMRKLVRSCESFNVSSIAIPALGCGLGQLNWGDVEPIITKYALELENDGTEVMVIKP